MTKRLSLIFLFSVSTLLCLHAADPFQYCYQKARKLLKLDDPAEKTSFYLGRRFTPSHIDYSKFACAIEAPKSD